MSKPGFKSVSIDDETDEMLQRIAAEVEQRTGVKLESNHKIIKYLAKKQLAGAKAAA